MKKIYKKEIIFFCDKYKSETISDEYLIYLKKENTIHIDPNNKVREYTNECDFASESCANCNNPIEKQFFPS